MIGHRPEIVTNSAPRTIGVTARHVALGALPTRQVVALDWPHPPVELLSVASWLGATSSSPAVPPDVPYASVRGGHPRTTTVHTHALRAGGSARTERTEGASQARGSFNRGSVCW